MVALDIFIGLVLIYFLYSLLASIIVEMVSTWIGMRARMLRQGIDNLLNDKQPVQSSLEAFNTFYSHYWNLNSWSDRFRFAWNTLIYNGFSGWIKDVFLIEPGEFKFSNAGRFYKEPSVKYMAKVGDNAIYSTRHTKPAYISKENFTHTILNMLTQRSQGINEWDKVKFAIKHNAMSLEPETHKMFQDWIARSNDNYGNFITNIERTFEDMMDRVNGWYKRKVGLFLFWIGFVMVMIMNVDSIEIVKILANNPEKRKAMVELAIQTIEAEKLLQDTTSKDNLKKSDSLRMIQLKEQYGIVKNSVSQSQFILGSKWVFPDSTYTKSYKKYYKAKHILAQSLPWKLKFWGFLITALALSLGSQFWYDLLKKLVALRGAGVKPEERDEKLKEELQIKKNGNDGLRTIEFDPVKQVIAQNRNYWESLPGFISVEEEVDETNRRFIKLTFEKSNAPYFEKKFVASDTEVWVRSVEGIKGNLGVEPIREALDGALLQLSTNSWGSPAGIVKNTRTGKYSILTCGHVVRTEKSSFINKDLSAIHIKNQNERTFIGKVTNMVMSGYCDAGIIDLEIGLNELGQIKEIPHIKNYRDTYFNLKGTQVIIKTLDKDIKGQIVKTDKYFSFNDGGSNVRYLDLLKISFPNGSSPAVNTTLTLNGDSGSLILDSEQIPIGILVGSGWEEGIPYSFGIKMKDIFQILQIDKSDLI